MGGTRAGETGAIGEQGDVGPEGPEGKEADIAGLASMGRSASPGLGLWFLVALKAPQMVACGFGRGTRASNGKVLLTAPKIGKISLDA